jgi:hypothetical protein
VFSRAASQRLKRRVRLLHAGKIIRARTV